MQKVYLLLRSNKQTGPYSLEELLQLNLKPFDLVWVEGRSAAWQYPSEIPSLKSYVPETPQATMPFQPITTSAMEEKPAPVAATEPGPVQQPVAQKPDLPKRVFVSVPKTFTPAAEEKTAVAQASLADHRAYMPTVNEASFEPKEEVKQNAALPSGSNTSSFKQKAVEEEIHTNYSRSVNDVEEDYTNWVYQQKTKRKARVNPKDLILAALVVAVIGGGYYIMSRPSVANSVLPTNKAITETAQPEEGIVQEPSSTETVLPGEKTVSATTDNSAANPVKESKIIKTKNPGTVPKGQTASSVPVIENAIPTVKTNSGIPENNETTAQQPETKDPRQDVPAEKKKKFGEVLKGIFSKKEKKEEPKNEPVVTDNPKPATNRQATRREDDGSSSGNAVGSDETSTASLMEQIDLSSNAPDNWMMGVKNLKITLRNRSNATIQTAAVSVSYYDENNQLLEKKLVYFSNIAPKAKATAAVPDHKFADHVDFRLTSATPKEDRYAKY